MVKSKLDEDCLWIMIILPPINANLKSDKKVNFERMNKKRPDFSFAFASTHTKTILAMLAVAFRLNDTAEGIVSNGDSKKKKKKKTPLIFIFILFLGFST